MNSTDRQAELDASDQNDHDEFVAQWRGRELLPGIYRQFCCRCGLPFTVTDKRLRDRTTLLCERCPPRSSGNTIATTAFSPDRRMST